MLARKILWIVAGRRSLVYMRRTVALVSVVLCVGCGGGTVPGPAASTVSAFEKVADLDPPMNSEHFEGGPSISSDGLQLYFITDRDVTNGGEIWVASRSSTSEAFSKVQKLGPAVNSSADEGAPSISADGRELFFDRSPDGHIFIATRSSTSGPFARVAVLDLGNTACCDGFPNISSDGLDLYFCSSRPGGFGGDDIWVASRASRSSSFAPPVNLGSSLNTAASDCDPNISSDGLTLFLASDRKGGSGGLDIWVAVRASRSVPFGRPVNLGHSVNSGFSDERPGISADGRTLFFMSNRVGGHGSFDLWAAT